MFLRNHAALLLFAVSPIVVYGQSTGEIKLHVIAPSSASLRASGRLNGLGGVYHTFETDGQGALDLTGLAPGHYRIQIIRSGFAPQIVALDLTAATPITREIKLGLQSASTSVTVFSPTPIGQADQSLDQIPVPVQGITAKNLEDSNASTSPTS
jgi:hypothetical protein